jgi:hypothetical protein
MFFEPSNILKLDKGIILSESIKNGYKIPNIIHQTFCSEILPGEIADVIKKNKIICKNSTFIFYNDNDCDLLIKNNFNEEITEIFENILFKKKSHLKCRIGITIITQKLFVHWNYDLQILKNMVKQLFLNYFKYNIDEFVNDEKEEECFEIIPKKRKRTEQIT